MTKISAYDTTAPIVAYCVNVLSSIALKTNAPIIMTMKTRKSISFIWKQFFFFSSDSYHQGRQYQLKVKQKRRRKRFEFRTAKRATTMSWAAQSLAPTTIQRQCKQTLARALRAMRQRKKKKLVKNGDTHKKNNAMRKEKLLFGLPAA